MGTAGGLCWGAGPVLLFVEPAWPGGERAKLLGAWPQPQVGRPQLGRLRPVSEGSFPPPHTYPCASVTCRPGCTEWELPPPSPSAGQTRTQGPSPGRGLLFPSLLHVTDLCRCTPAMAGREGWSYSFLHLSYSWADQVLQECQASWGKSPRGLGSPHVGRCPVWGQLGEGEESPPRGEQQQIRGSVPASQSGMTQQ